VRRGRRRRREIRRKRYGVCAFGGAGCAVKKIGGGRGVGESGKGWERES